MDERYYDNSPQRSPAICSYEMYPEIKDWLLHALPFLPFEKSVFVYFRGIKYLAKIVTDVKSGLCPRIEADMAIRAYNEDNYTDFTYSDIVFATTSMDSWLDMGRHVYSPTGEWAVYTDQPNLVLLGEYDDPLEAFQNAHPDVNWLLLEIPERQDVDGEYQPEELLVFRSPYTGPRYELPGDENLALGLHGGSREAYVIPPEIEAAVGTCPDILEMQCTTSTR